jgi:hypothetical protein
MCDGISEGLAVAGLAAAVVGAGASAYGAYQQTQSSNKAAAYNSQVANYQAAQALQLGKVEAAQHDAQVAQLRGRQTAAYGAAGVDPNTGSPLTLGTQTAGYGALDSLAIKQNAASQAWGYGNSANLDHMKEVNPYGTAGLSLLQSSSSVGSSLMTANRAGVF